MVTIVSPCLPASFDAAVIASLVAGLYTALRVSLACARCLASYCAMNAVATVASIETTLVMFAIRSSQVSAGPVQAGRLTSAPAVRPVSPPARAPRSV